MQNYYITKLNATNTQSKKAFLEWNSGLRLLRSFERLLTDYYKWKKAKPKRGKLSNV